MPYLTSIFSKPTNGDLLEWRFERLADIPDFLEAENTTPSSSESRKEGTAPFGFGSVNEPFPEEPVLSAPDASEIDGHWIVESVSIGQAVSNPDIIPAELGDLIIAGHWLLSVDPGGKISKGLVSIKKHSNPKQINFTTSLEDSSDSHGVHWGIYKSDESSLDICCAMPEVTGKDTEGNPELFSREELDDFRRKAALLLTEECFDEPLRDNRVIWRCRRMSKHFRTPIQTRTPNVEGIVLDSRQANQTGTPLIEISIGEDDGLVEGQEWSIHRKVNRTGEAPGIQPLGKMRLKLVTPDRSIGIGTLQHEGAEFQKGDIVTSVPQ